MSKLSKESRTQIIHMLCRGASIRFISDVTRHSRDTVRLLLNDVGDACLDFHNRHLRDLQCKVIQMDEIQTFVYAQSHTLRKAEERGKPMRVPSYAGDLYTWVALCGESKLVIAWRNGARGSEDAIPFVQDVADRLAKKETGQFLYKPHITTDGLNAYKGAIERAFGINVGYAQLVKKNNKELLEKYLEERRQQEDEEERLKALGIVVPPKPKTFDKRKGEEKFLSRFKILGNPNPILVHNGWIERQNGTIRELVNRYTRETKGFSKKMKNHNASFALYCMFYNFCWEPRKLYECDISKDADAATKAKLLEKRNTPAMEAGLTDRLWAAEHIEALTH